MISAICSGLISFPLVAQAFPHLAEEVHGVDELNLSLASAAFSVGDDPDVRADARVIEELIGQGDNGFEPVVLDDPTPDLALARPGRAGEQWRAVEDDRQPRAGAVVLELGDHVLKEEERAVADPRQARPEPTAEAELFMLVVNELLNFLPLDPERRVREEVFEPLPPQAVLGEAVAELDVRGVLALDEHVALADGVGLRVQLLAERLERGTRVQLAKVVLGHREHPARAARGVVQGADDPLFAECVIVLDEQDVDHQPDHLTRGEVVPRLLVREFRGPPDQFLEGVAHLDVLHLVGVEVDRGEPLHDEVKEVGLVEPIDLVREPELLGEDLAGTEGEAVDVMIQVRREVVLIGKK